MTHYRGSRMEKGLDGKRILIVGGATGIGLAVAMRALDEGAQVIIASRSAPERADSMENFLHERVEAFAVDLTSGKEPGSTG